MRPDLEQLAGAIEAISLRSAEARRGDAQPRLIATGWPEVDATLGGGLRVGQVHEWFGSTVSESQTPVPRISRIPRQPWFPPMCVLLHLAAQTAGSSLVMWIGKRCWPHLGALIRLPAPEGCSLAERSLFVDPPDDAARLWAIDLALRSSAVAAVIADGARLDMAATRRLQLAAEAGGSIGLLARPATEMKTLSASMTRWLVCPTVHPTIHSTIHSPRAADVNPRWSVHLLRRKGVRPVLNVQPSCWTLEYDRAKGTVRASADVVDRPGQATLATIPQRLSA